MIATLYINFSAKFPKSQYIPKGASNKAVSVHWYTWILACLLMILALFPPEVRSAGSPQKKFLILDKLPKADGLTLPGDFPPSIRWRAVILNPVVTKGNKIKTGDELVLNLFPDSEYIGHIERVEENVHGVVTVSGWVNNYPAGHIVITTSDNDTFVEIRIPQKKKIYRIQSHPEQDFSYLLELDVEKMDIKEGAPPLLPPDS